MWPSNNKIKRMKRGIISAIIVLLIGFEITLTTAQISSSSDNLVAQPFTDRTVFYDISDTGVSRPITWGLDLAWLDEVNVIRGIRFMGKNNVDIIRSSFMPTNPLVGDTALQDIEPYNALYSTNLRINIIKNNLGAGTKVMLNDDNPTVAPYFYGNAVNWAKLIEATAKLHQKQGLKVVSVAPFNEPDNTGAGQGTVQDFYNICTEIRKNSFFDSMRISGPNMLNTDVFFDWYNPLKNILDEGNTHQLAGSFNNYALIYQTVRANGQHATNDELHNVMEAMVGVEYGLQTGIWWGTAEYARGEFCKASNGERLGYAEHRPNWTAASVYRAPDGKVQAFIGCSERQGVTTTYRFVSKDRDVFYDGHGPQREYIMELPTGDPNTYQTPKHTGGERVINISWGDDIQPVIDGKYVLVNRNSGKVMEAANGSSVNGANMQQNTYLGATYQQWNVNPINPRNGGDFSYFTITGVQSGKHLDITNASLNNGGNAIMWDKGTWWDGRQSLNQVWYLEYAEDGWFYIRNQFSSKCLEVANNSISNGANIQQWEKDGGTNQQWRFIPVGVNIELTPPAGAPGNFVATANAASVKLDWSTSPETDIAGYTIFRADSVGGAYNTIARNVTTTSFVDNTATSGGPYFYKIKAVDKCLNSSPYSNEVSATPTGNNDLVAHFQFEGNTTDNTVNLNRSATYGEISFVDGKIGSQAISLNGTDAFIQLPSTIANHQEITIATWIYWNGGSYVQRIFDFGNSDSENMFLSPGLFGGKMRFTVRNEAEEQILETTKLPTGKWSHVAVTLGTSGACIYVNGELAAESPDITIRPLDFKPILNYIGRSQTDPLLNGYIDDFRIYNYALSASEITQIPGVIDGIKDINYHDNNLSVWPVPVNDKLHASYSRINNVLSTLSIYNADGSLVSINNINSNTAEIDVSGIPSGVYLLKVTTSEEFIMKKLIIKH